MFSKRVYRWNSVDVVGCDGLLHRGLVVNKSKAGLYIDFGTSNRQSTLVSYNRVFRDPKPDTQKQEPLEQGDVELLYQLSTDQPWKWYPAQLLSTSADPFLLVDMQTEDDHVRAVFRADRVRRRSLPRVIVRRNDFVKEDVPIPAGFQATTDFCNRWKERIPNTYPVGVVGDRFVYVQSRYDKEIPLEFSIALVNMTEAELVVLPHGIKRPLDDLLADEAMDTIENSSLITKLAMEILAEVFNSMDILEQTKLRRVCVRFADAISSPACNISIVDPGVERMDIFTLTSSLFAILWRRATYAIFAKNKHDFVDAGIVLLQKIVNAAGSKVPQLILVDVSINARLVMNYSNAALPPAFRSVCTRLILKNVTVDEVLVGYGPLGRYGYEDMRIGHCALNTGDEAEFRHAFEAHSKTREHAELRGLGEWIRALGLAGESRRSAREMVTTVLKQWQHDDCRFGPDCAWEDVDKASLWGKLGTLRKSTLWALLSTMNNFD